MCWLALIGAFVAVEPTYAPPDVVLRGNVALPDEVYHSMIDLAGLLLDKKTTLRSAKRLAREVEDFLVNAGYEIASVRGDLDSEGRLRLVIDEGRLTRIIYRGANDFRTAQLRIAVQVPQNIFNRPALIRQIDALREEFGYTSLDFELVPSKEVDHLGPQVTDFGEIAGVQTVPKTGRYDLIVTFGKKSWATGFGFNLDLRPPDGIKIGGIFGITDLMFEHDRWRLRADVGANQFGRIFQAGNFVSISRATFELRFEAPPLFGIGLRPSARFFLDYMRRTRPDIGLQTYDWLRQGVELNVGYDFTRSIQVTLGGGYEYRQLIDNIEQPDSPINFKTQESFQQVQGFINAGGYFLFDPDNIRLDRRHELDIDASLYLGEASRFTVRAWYQKIFEFGWHDLYVRGYGLGVFDSSRFVDQESLGWFVRGVFAAVHWTKRGVSGMAEFRFSITRDLLKIGVFQETAVFEKPKSAITDSRAMAATAQGISMHFLILDTFQADLYYSIGVDTRLRVEQALNASLRKAF